MRLVIDAPVSQREIPTEVDLRFIQMPGFGTRVVATISIDDSALTFEMIDGKLAADVDIGGILYDDKGKPINSFVGRLRIFPRTGSASTTGFHDEAEAIDIQVQHSRARRSLPGQNRHSRFEEQLASAVPWTGSSKCRRSSYTQSCDIGPE
jgi:hypothetical protein